MKTLGSSRSGAPVDEENPYWISFSDIMAGLLVIFVLAAVALILELEQKRDEWDKTIAQIAKAEEVDRKFKIVAATVGTTLKRAIVEAASALAGFIDSFRAFEDQRKVTAPWVF